jgi:hypothetical protein
MKHSVPHVGLDTRCCQNVQAVAQFQMEINSHNQSVVPARDIWREKRL